MASELWTYSFTQCIESAVVSLLYFSIVFKINKNKEITSTIFILRSTKYFKLGLRPLSAYQTLKAITTCCHVDLAQGICLAGRICHAATQFRVLYMPQFLINRFCSFALKMCD